MKKSKDKQIAFFINVLHLAFCCNVSIKLMLGEGSNLNTITTLLVSFIFATCFIYLTFTVFHDKRYILLYLFFISIYVISYLLGKVDVSLLVNKGILTMVTCVPVLAGVMYMKDKKILYEMFLRFSYPTIIVMLPAVMLHQGSEYSYSMSFSYYLLLPCLFQLDQVFKTRHIKNVIFCIISVLAILSYGARGPIMCLAGAVIFEVIFMEVKMLKKVFIIVIFVLSCWLIVVNLYSIIDWLQEFLDNFGIYSRSLEVLKNPSIDMSSGRTDLFEYYIPYITENPLLGSGVYGNWISDGLGPHNTIIEYFMAFGLVFGTLALAVLVMIPILLVKKIDIYTKRLLIVFLSYNITMFFVSGNFMTSYNWFLLYGLILSQFKFKGGFNHVKM